MGTRRAVSCVTGIGKNSWAWPYLGPPRLGGEWRGEEGDRDTADKLSTVHYSITSSARNSTEPWPEEPGFGGSIE
jgi:hypothetical protein